LRASSPLPNRYVNETLNRLETVSLWSTFVTLYAGLYYHADFVDDTAILTGPLTIVMVLWHSLVIGLFALVGIRFGLRAASANPALRATLEARAQRSLFWRYAALVVLRVGGSSPAVDKGAGLALEQRALGSSTALRGAPELTRRRTGGASEAETGGRAVPRAANGADATEPAAASAAPASPAWQSFLGMASDFAAALGLVSAAAALPAREQAAARDAAANGLADDGDGSKDGDDDADDSALESALKVLGRGAETVLKRLESATTVS
jgi:hypothetical protein